MAAKIYVNPEDIWDFYLENIHDIWNGEAVIAENSEYGIKIYLYSETYGALCIEVEMDGYPIHEEIITRDASCAILSKIYDEFLSDRVADFIEDVSQDYQYYDSPYTREQEQEEQIEEREDDLDEALDCLMDTFASNILEVVGKSIYPEFREELKDYIGEFLYRNWGVSIYRPMYLDDENGNSCFEEFPYALMEFEN